MAIIKDTIHPQNSPQDDIYPKTSVDQVEGLQEALDTSNTTLHRISFTINNILFNLSLFASKETPFTSVEDIVTYYQAKNPNLNTFTIYGVVRPTLNNVKYYGTGNIAIDASSFSYNVVAGNSNQDIRFFSGIFSIAITAIQYFQDEVIKG